MASAALPPCAGASGPASGLAPLASVPLCVLACVALPVVEPLRSPVTTLSSVSVLRWNLIDEGVCVCVCEMCVGVRWGEAGRQDPYTLKP